MEALYTAIRSQIPEDCPHDLLHLAMHAHGFQHAFPSANIRVEDLFVDVAEQPLVIIFHNLKGFDGVFLLKELYQDCRRVESQACIRSFTDAKLC